ncbi:hypothetical protein HYH02_009790 [Chlamydomonas schloesseri]|uniref:Pherophorin domain-containing protein n=1 Tax=Chlamydomonas schloesseri TaxID=2026947 RepID=A0A835TB99_9CHLO|nr:hypothetical protein HYH02_009790 [Chlamydomonas schloesseri]|eukprot:KAG2441998.1 hypothetical protein HYH02_009790 [Chlamydomonas schloesseri]
MIAWQQNRVLSIVAALLVAAVASSRRLVVEGALYASFPFCKCSGALSPYSLDPVVTSAGSGKYCFRLRVQAQAVGCAGNACCGADLRKIEFNVSAACASRTTRVSATINGQPTKVGPAFERPKQGPAGAAVLRLTQLGLGLGDDGAEVCISLRPNRKAPGCTTLQALCAPPVGMPPGTCSAALFDSSGGCCAKSDVGSNISPSPRPSPNLLSPSPTLSPKPSPSPTPTPSPPPRASPPPSPSPPPPPTPPPPPARYCTSCVSLNFTVDPDLRPPWLTDQDLSHAMDLYHSPQFCTKFQSDVAARLNALMLSLRIYPFDPHGYNPSDGVSGCSPVVRVCTRFSASMTNSVADATTMGRIAADLAAREFLPAITGSTGGGAANGEGGLAASCDPLFRAYRVTIYDWADDCYRFNVSVTCPAGQPPAP